MKPSSRLLYGAHVRANGIRQHYLRYGGAGMPLVLVPGIISTAAMWGPIAERLAVHLDVHVLDVRGRGLSETGAHLDYGLDVLAADVVAFAEAAGLREYVLLGHSMGARIGVRAARKPGLPIRHLILVDPPVSGPGRRPYPSQLAGVLELLRAARAGEAERVLRESSSPAWPEEMLRLRAEWLHTCDEQAAVAAHRGFHEDDIHADLPDLKVPATLIAASRGGVILPDDIAELRSLSPAMRVTTVPNAGHQIAAENPEGFLAAVGECLHLNF